jgi:DNA-binding LacI/PurR family transcriptional regulator
MAGNDLMALGAVAASSARGNGSEPASVIGYDGTEFTAYTDPPLTTLRQPFEDMAQLIADAVTSEIDGSLRYRDHYVFEPQLVTRDSTHSHRRAAAPLG